MLVSVIIPCYNRSHTIQRAIQSVLAQTCQDLEIIVVDDGSRDATPSVLDQLCSNDSRIHYLWHPENRGAQAARNTGIRAAQAEWIAFLDSDDEWLSHSLQVRLAEANARNVKVVHSEGYVIREDGIKKPFGVPKMSDGIYRDILTRPGPIFPTLLVSKEALNRIGYLDEQIISWQEWDTSIRLAKHYAFGFVDEPTFVYDCRGNDTISKNLLRDARGYEQIIRKHCLPILIHGGPYVLARHYQTLASRYERARDQENAWRCKRLAFIWWPLRLRTIAHWLGRLLSS